MKISKKGISLIVLVITILVIIILAGAIILSLTNGNPISQASKATYLSDLKNFQTELSMYETTQFSDKLGEYDLESLQADDASVTYKGVVDTSKSMYDLIPSLQNNTKYAGQFQVIDGQLVFGGLDNTKQDWSREVGIDVVIIGEPKVTIIPPSRTLAQQGTDIVYTVKYSSNAALTTIDLTNKLELLDDNGIALANQPVMTIGTISGTSLNSTRQVDVTIKTDNLANGSYKLKIKPGSVTNANNISSTIDTISLIGFEILDSIPPENPSMSAQPTVWTNGNVTVSITYSTDSSIKEYSLDAVTWNSYTSPVVVSENNTTVYARGKDLAKNESGVATLTVSNIDKIVPTVIATNGGSTSSSVTVTAAASDTGGSGLVASSYQYSKDNGTTWESATSDTSHVFNGLTTGIYQCKVKVIDNAGNSAISEAVAISTQELGTITLSSSLTTWTNGNVTVTATYPSEVVTKQYSTDGTTWNVYTNPIVVSANNTTIYAKGLDAGGNQTAQATITVSNIDKTAPTVTATNGSSTTSSVTVTAVASDSGGSGLVTSSYQYSKDNGTTWTTATSDISYVFSGLTTGTYQCKVKVADNAGNSAISDAVAISTQGLGTITLTANITTWTNGNVTITATYPSEVVTKQYSTDGTTWNVYTNPIVVSANNTTVYAKGLDAGGNQTTQATLTVANIDKTVPTVTAANGGSTSSSVTVTATASDAGGSGLVTNGYQYSKDNGTTWTAVTSATSYLFSGLTTGTYQCKVKVADNAGNSAISSAVAITTQGVGTITLAASTTAWTNGNVNVTITYPAAVVTKQYSTDGSTWNTYSTPVVVSVNNTTVYAKGLDSAGNQTAQATLTVSNIDKAGPTVPTFMGMTYSDGVTNYTNGTWAGQAVYMYGGISGSTDAASGVNRYQISADNVNWVDYAYNYQLPLYGLTSGGTYYRYARAVDNAGNVSGSYGRTIYIDITAPNAYNMTVTKTKDSITISGATTDGESGMSGYHYYINGSWTGRTTATSYTYTGLQSGTTYTIYMTAYNNAGLQTGANGGVISVTTDPNTYTYGNMGSNGYGTIRTPASTSNPTELCVKGVGQALTSGVHIDGLNIKAGDTISVTYATSRSSNYYYLDLYDSQHVSGQYFYLNIQPSQNMVTMTNTFTAAYNSSYYELSIFKSNYDGSDIYGTLYIYNINVNGIKVF